MATATRLRLEGDQWVEVPATWGAYLRLLRARGDRATPKYTFHDGGLTIVSPGMSHECLKSRLAWMIEEIFVTLGIDFLPSGSLTLKQGEPHGRGVEGDASYYLRNLDLVRNKERIVMGVDPAPDLEIEVGISNPVRESLLAHAAFGVREVWVCEPDGLTFLVLGGDGRYQPAQHSGCFPFVSSGELADWIFNDEIRSEPGLRRAFREWVSNTLAPRREEAGGGQTAETQG